MSSTHSSYTRLRVRLQFCLLGTIKAVVFTIYLGLAAVAFLHSIASFGFPLFAPYMFQALGYGKGNTILAAFFFGLGCPSLVLFYIYGERIRSMSKRVKPVGSRIRATSAPP